jgi:hypothetical protein
MLKDCAACATKLNRGIGDNAPSLRVDLDHFPGLVAEVKIDFVVRFGHSKEHGKLGALESRRALKDADGLLNGVVLRSAPPLKEVCPL